MQVIRNQDNLGFAKACNQGARAARGEYLVFLNNDTIPLNGWLTALIEEVRTHSDVAVVGSKLLYEDGTIQHAGVAFSREWFLPYHIYRGFDAHAASVSRRRELDCVTAACMLVRREAFEEVGGFDEGYRNGFEDVDLCLKIREKNRKTRSRRWTCRCARDRAVDLGVVLRLGLLEDLLQRLPRAVDDRHVRDDAQEVVAGQRVVRQPQAVDDFVNLQLVRERHLGGRGFERLQRLDAVVGLFLARLLPVASSP